MRVDGRDVIAERLVVALLALTVVGSLLAVGAVHLPVLVVISALLAAAVTLGSRAQRAKWPFPATLAFALAGYTLIQAIPLPTYVLARVAPMNADVWHRSLHPFGEAGPSWAPISLDPGASIVEALKWFTYALAFVASAMAGRRNTAILVGMVFGAAVLGALATIGHGLVGAERVFGLYKPHFEPPPWHVGPLLNPNNLSGYLNLGALCGLGLLLSRETVVPRWLIGIGIATIIGVDVTAASRAGVIALPIGLLIFSVLLIRRSHGRTSRLPRNAAPWLFAAALGGGVLLAILGATSETWKELWDKNLQKLELLKWVVPMARQHPWFGVGRGAFESVFPAYRNAPGNISYSHAENFAAEWVAGWGIPIGCAALVGLGALLNPVKLKVRRSALLAAVWSGLIALLIQNLADLALEVPAVCLGAVVLLGAMYARAAPEQDRFAPRQTALSSRFKVWAPAGICAALSIAAFAWGNHDLDDDRTSLFEKLRTTKSQPETRQSLMRELHAAMLRHPAEPYFPLLGASFVYTTRNQNPLPWLERALERDITNGRAHLLLADVLIGRGVSSQSMLELRLAIADDHDLLDAIAKRAIRWTRNCDELERVAPAGEIGASLLGTAASYLTEHTDEPCRERLARTAAARAPSLPLPHMLIGDLLIARIRAAEGACAGSGGANCSREVQDQARALETIAPRSILATQLRVNLMLALHQHEEAAKLLESQCGLVDERVACLRLKIEVSTLLQPRDRLEIAIKEYVALACTNADACAAAEEYSGDILMSVNHPSSAMGMYARAARESPTEPRWLKYADASAKAGAHADAAAALGKVVALRGGADDQLRARIEDERQQALRALH